MNNLYLLWQLAIGGLNTGRGVFTRRRPTGAALRNPKQPAQAARIEAAAAKRERKAEKLWMTASALPNRAHLLSYNRNSLNPFYINH